jgi:predicted DsbA family dithiol-disulfide isomerase
MAEKALDDDGIARILKEKGVDLAKARADMQSEAVTKKIEENRALAHAIGVDGTPGFVVGDKVIGGFLEDEIIAATKTEKTSAPATMSKPGA